MRGRMACAEHHARIMRGCMRPLGLRVTSCAPFMRGHVACIELHARFMRGRVACVERHARPYGLRGTSCAAVCARLACV